MLDCDAYILGLLEGHMISFGTYWKSLEVTLQAFFKCHLPYQVSRTYGYNAHIYWLWWSRDYVLVAIKGTLNSRVARTTTLSVCSLQWGSI